MTEEVFETSCMEFAKASRGTWIWMEAAKGPGSRPYMRSGVTIPRSRGRIEGIQGELDVTVVSASEAAQQGSENRATDEDSWEEPELIVSHVEGGSGADSESKDNVESYGELKRYEYPVVTVSWHRTYSAPVVHFHMAEVGGGRVLTSAQEVGMLLGWSGGDGEIGGDEGLREKYWTFVTQGEADEIAGSPVMMGLHACETKEWLAEAGDDSRGEMLRLWLSRVSHVLGWPRWVVPMSSQ